MGVSPIKVFGLVHAEVLGTLMASAALLPVCLLKPKQPLIHFLYETLLPIAAVTIMLLIAFPLPWLKTSGMLLIGIYVFFSMAALLALALGIGSAHSGEFPTDLVFAALVFAFAALTLAGLAFGSGLSESASEHAALPFIVTLYCAYLLLTPILKHARTGLGDRSAKDATVAGSETSAAIAEADPTPTYKQNCTHRYRTVRTERPCCKRRRCDNHASDTRRCTAGPQQHHQHSRALACPVRCRQRKIAYGTHKRQLRTR